MPFENIGIGGILDFDSRAAVANMGRASSGFRGVTDSAGRLRASMANLSTNIGKFNVLGTVMGATAGISFGGIVKSGFEFNSQIENARISIGGMISDIGKLPIGPSLELASEAVAKLNRIAAETPGEFSDVLNITRLVTGGILAAGGSMNEVLNASKGVAIAAGDLGVEFTDAGRAVQTLLSGQVEIGNRFVAVLKSTGKLTESTEKWRALLPEQRLKRMNEILGSFASRGALIGGTFEAQKSTLVSVGKEISAAFTTTLFDRMKTTLGSINDAFFKNRDAVLAFAKTLGVRLGTAFDFMIQQSIVFGRSVKSVFSFLKEVLGPLIGQTGSWNVNMAGVVFQFTAWAAILVPIVAGVGFVISKVVALFQIVSALTGVVGSLGGVFTAVMGAISAPVVLAVAAFGALAFIIASNEELLNGLKETAILVGNIIFESLGLAFEAVSTLFKDAIQPMLPFFIEMGNVVKDWATEWGNILQSIIGKLKAVLDWLRQLRGGFQEATGSARVGASAPTSGAASIAAKRAAEEQTRAKGIVTPSRSDEKPKLTLDQKFETTMKVDGRNMAKASARHTTEVQERAGFTQAPWQRSMVNATGVSG